VSLGLIYTRSDLGMRVRSPLGAFVARTQLAIDILPLYIEDGLTYDITGRSFGATQGTGKLEIANTPAFDDVVVEQTVSAWANTELTFTYDGTGLPTEGILFVKVTGDSALYDTAVTQAGAIVDDIGIGAGTVSGGSTGSGTTPGSAIFCGLDAGYYCYAFFDGFYSQLVTLGYAFGTLEESFFNTTPGFYLVGLTSGKTVEFGSKDHFYNIVSLGYIDATVWCGVEGLSAAFSSISGSAYGLVILYESLTSPASCASSHGWTANEDVALVPKYPLSIQITSPVSTEAPTYTDITLTAYSYAAEGDISAGIEWYVSVDGSAETLYYTGATTTITIEGDTDDTDYTFYARSQNANGQQRQATITVAAIVPVIDSFFPLSGNSAGGQRVTIRGGGFHSSTTIDFDGNAATGVTAVSVEVIQCVTPAGSGSVLVDAIQGGWTNQALDEFVYGAAENISITSIDNTADSVAGGGAMVITGTGFTSDCIVYFGQWPDILVEADNTVFVDDTEITCDVPEWLDGEGVVDIIIHNPTNDGGDILRQSFEYTTYVIRLDEGTFTLAGQDVTLTYP